MPLVLLLQPESVTARGLLELGVYALLLIVCLGHKPLRDALLGMGTLRLAGLALFLLLAVAAQLYKSSTWTYPFATWTMYSDPAPAPTYPRYEAVLQSGATMDFPFQSVSPSRSDRAFGHGFDGLVSELAGMDEDDPARAVGAAELSEVLSEVGSVFNRRQPRDAIQAIHVSLCQVPLVGYDGQHSVSCHPVLSVGIGE